MAKKDLKLDEWKPDPALDFDFDFEIDTNLDQQAKKSRSPITNLAVGVAEGTASTLLSRGVYQDLLKAALPPHYGEITEGLSDITTGLSELYDQTRKEVKPRINRISQSLDKMVPEESKFLKKITGKIIEVSGGKESKYSGPSESAQEEQGVALLMADIFKAQQAEGKIEGTRQMMRDAIDEKRYKGTTDLSSRMQRDISTLAQYTTTITQAYQKKSLELQFRTYLGQRSYFTKSLQIFQALNKQNDAIIRNTSLPDAQKLTEWERAKNIGKDRLINGLYGEGSAWKKGMERLKSSAADYVQGMTMRSDMMEFGIDMASAGIETMQSINKTMVENGFPPMTKEQFAGAQAANWAIETVALWGGPKLHAAAKKNPELFEKVSKAARIFVNPTGAISKFRKSDYLKEKKEGEGFLGKVARGFDTLLGNWQDRITSASFSTRNDEDELEQGKGFDKKAYLSLTHVIPGYLAMIHQEISVLRTNKPQKLLRFDYNSGSFKTAAKMEKEILGRMTSTAQRTGLGYKANAAVDELTSATEKTTDEEMATLYAFITKLSLESNTNWEHEDVKELKAYKDLTPDAQKIVDKIFENQEAAEDKEQKKTAFAIKMRDMRDSRINFNDAIRKEVKAGQGDLLAKLGIVSHDDGIFDPNIDYLQKFTEKHTGIAPSKGRVLEPKSPDADGESTSDVNTKEDISPATPTGLLKRLGQKAYEGMKKTKLYNWRYKASSGHDPDQMHSGPMAQDVNKNLGEEAAPGGKKLDLATMNGTFFAAVQHLGDRVDNLFKGKKEPKEEDDALTGKKSPLQNINRNVARITALLYRQRGQGGAGQQSSGGSGDPAYREGFDLNFFMDKGIAGGKAVGNGLVRAGDAAIEGAGKGIGKVAETVSNIWLANKDQLKTKAIWLFNKSSDLAGTVFDASKNFLTKIVPDWLGKAKDFGKSVLQGIGDQFGVMKDLYLPDGTEPIIRAVKLKAGEYYDEASGVAVTTMEELKKVKGNIVDKAGNVILTATEMKNGLVDRYGDSVRSVAGTVTAFALSGAKYVGQKLLSAANTLKDAATVGFSKSKEWWSTAPEFSFPDVSGGFGHKKLLAELINIRDIMLGDTKAVRKRVRKAQAAEAMKAAAMAAFKNKTKEMLTDAKEGVQSKAADLSTRYMGEGTSLGNLLKKIPSLSGASGRAAALATVATRGDDFIGPLTPEEMKAKEQLEKTKEGIKGRFGKVSDFLKGKLGKGSGEFMGPLPREAYADHFMGPMPQSASEKGLSWLQKAKARGDKLLGKNQPQEAFTGPLPREAHEGHLMGPMPQTAGEKAKSWFQNMRTRGQEMYNQRQGNQPFTGPLPREAHPEHMMGPQPQSRTQKVMGGLGKAGGFLKGKLGGVASLAGGLLAGSAGNTESPGAGVDGVEGKTDQQKEADARKATEAGPLKKRGGQVAQKDRAAGDNDGDGVKDGSVEDRQNKIEDLKASRDKGMLDADTSTKYKSPENVLDSMAKKASGLMSSLSTGLGTVFDVASTLFSGGSTAVRGALAAAKGSMTLGRAVFTGFRAYSAAVALSTSLSMSAIATTAGIALSAAGAVATTVLGVLASPFVLIPAAIAAVSYGLYKLYQYSNRDNASDMERLRLRQYGFAHHTNVDRYNHHVYLLESYLQDGRMIYNGDGSVKVNTKKINVKEMLSLFDIDEKDKEGAERFSTWFDKRFKPVFYAHVQALFRVDKKKKLHEVNDLTPEQKLPYLEVAKFPNGPYKEDLSPFGEKLELDVNSDEVMESYDNLILKVSDEIKKGAKKHKGIEKPSASAKMLEQLPTVPPKEGQKVDAAKAANDPAAGGDGDGKGAIKDESKKDTGASSGPGSVAMAAGSILNGEGGMQFIKLRKGAKIQGLSPMMLKNFLGMAEEYGKLTGKTIGVNSGFRSYQDQAALHAADPVKASKPGNSNHELGLALDIDRVTANDLDKLGLMKKYGFTRPVGGEPWHIEPAGIQRNIGLAKKDAIEREHMIESSLGRGGGGWGSDPNTPMGTRNHDMAMRLLNATPTLVDNKVQDAKKTNALPLVKAANDDSAKPGTVSAALPIKDESTESKTSQLPETTVADANKANAPGAVTADSESGKETSSGSGSSEKQGGDVMAVIEDAAKKTGVDVNLLKGFAAVESGLNPNARNSSSSAQGLMQFMPDTWREMVSRTGKKYGIPANASPFDMSYSAIMGAEFIKQNMRQLKDVCPNPNAADLYLMHLLGATGARRFFEADPNQPADLVLGQQAIANKDLFSEGGRWLTIAQSYERIKRRVQDKASAFGIKMPTSGGPGLKAPGTPGAGNPSGPGLTKPAGGGVETTSTTSAPAPSSAAVPSAPSRGFSFDNTSAGYSSSSNQSGQRVDSPNIKLESLLEKSNDTAKESLQALQTIVSSLSEERLAKVLAAVVGALPAQKTEEETIKEKDKVAMGRTATARGSSLDLTRRNAA